MTKATQLQQLSPLPARPFGFDLTARSTRDELMDAPCVSPEDYARCLAELAQINALTRAHAGLLSWLERAVASLPHERPFTVLDVACGQGDLLRAIARWASKRGLRPRLVGLDANPRSTRAARAATDAAMDVRFETGDVFTHVLRDTPDFIVSSQFTHHLDDADVLRFVRWMEASAARGWAVLDLQRHPLALLGFPLLCRLAGVHPIVQHDGLVSIARSFRREDWASVLERAGVAGAQVTAHFPFRFCVGRLK